jgi:hypothetical protein
LETIMRCRDAGAALVELGLGLLDPREESALRAHLEHCPDCAAEARVERALGHALLSLREEYPHELDVLPRVGRRLAALRSHDLEEVPARQLGWAGAFATACLIGLAAGLWFLLPDLPPLLKTATGLASSLGGILEGLGRVLLALIVLPLKLLGVLARVLAGCGSLLARLEPVAVAAVALGYATMAATVTLVLGRDLRRPLLASRGKEDAI